MKMEDFKNALSKAINQNSFAVCVIPTEDCKEILQLLDKHVPTQYYHTEICDMKKDKMLTDILLICKGWYNKKIYHNTLEAFNAYYHKYYGCDNIVMNKAFAEYLFLRPLALKAIEIKPNLARYIFEPSYSIISDKEPFSDIMYDRLMGLIQMIDKDIFDLSKYNDMFVKAEECNYEDESIGII